MALTVSVAWVLAQASVMVTWDASEALGLEVQALELMA